MEFFFLYMVYHSRKTFNTKLPAAHYDTKYADRGTKIEGCDAMPVENKTKPLIAATRQFIHNHGSFNYAFFSTSCTIICHFATFEG